MALWGYVSSMRQVTTRAECVGLREVVGGMFTELWLPRGMESQGLTERYSQGRGLVTAEEHMWRNWGRKSLTWSGLACCGFGTVGAVWAGGWPGWSHSWLWGKWWQDLLVITPSDGGWNFTTGAESSASLYTRAKSNLGDRVLGEVENESFITLPGKGGYSGLLPRKTMCPHLGEIVRSFIVMVQRGRDQLTDIILMGWRWGKQESASPTFRFRLVWGLRACGQRTIVINFSHLEGVSVPAEQLKDIVVCICCWGTRTLPQGCTIVSLDCLFLPGLASPPFPN